jgi:hypothetical protein
VYEVRGVVRGVHLDDGRLEHEPQALLEDLLHVL